MNLYTRLWDDDVLASVISGTIYSLLFVGLTSFFYGFVLDDAFIAYRYAEHLAAGRGLVWNTGAEPVEGYTSFLWVILNAAGIAMGLDPVAVSKLISLLAALLIIWILTLAGSRLHPTLRSVLVGAVALSPPFALLTMQGLETALTALLVLIAAQLTVLLVATPSTERITAWYGATLMAFLSRPDTAPFSVGVFLGLSAVLAYKEDYGTVRDLLVTGVPFALAAGLYMLWRIDYFGYPFPNTFYIKVSTGQGIVKAAGIDYVRSFGDDILAPYLALLLGLSVYRLRQNFAPESLLKLIPIIVGGMLFGFYLLTITPIQGVVWRFIFPILPALLLASIYYIVDLLPQRAEVNRWLSVVMLFFFAAWTLRHMPLALFYRRAATQDDRVKVGRALAGLPGTMFTSESGALPYYSGWRAIDSLGINSEEIAHQGLSLQTLSALNPDLIVLSVDGRYSGAGNEVINQYMIDHGFVAVAAIHKALDLRHFYLARPDSPLFDAIVKRLLNVRDVQYGDLEELMDEARIPLVSGRSPEQ